jgi:hypothetical protein
VAVPDVGHTGACQYIDAGGQLSQSGGQRGGHSGQVGSADVDLFMVWFSILVLWSWQVFEGLGEVLNAR